VRYPTPQEAATARERAESLAKHARLSCVRVSEECLASIDPCFSHLWARELQALGIDFAGVPVAPEERIVYLANRGIRGGLVGRGVEKVPGRCGGDAVLVGTRMPVRCVDGFYRDGGDDAVQYAYPHLTAQQRQDAYDYAKEHRAELDAERAALDAEAEETVDAFAVEMDRQHANCEAKREAAETRLAALLDALKANPGCRVWAALEDFEKGVGLRAADQDRRVQRALAALRLVRSRWGDEVLLISPRRGALIGVTQEVVDAVNLALKDEPPPPEVSVRDMSGDGSGPWRLFMGDHGIATWPSGGLEDAGPRAYAEEVARCLRVALGAES
jgi:uncharacterized protein (DUF433 family)